MGPLWKQLENISPAAFHPILSVLWSPLFLLYLPCHRFFLSISPGSILTLLSMIETCKLLWIFTLGIKTDCIVSAATTDSVLDCMLGINILFEEDICALVELFLNMKSDAPGLRVGNEMKWIEEEHTWQDLSKLPYPIILMYFVFLIYILLL